MRDSLSNITQTLGSCRGHNSGAAIRAQNQPVSIVQQCLSEGAATIISILGKNHFSQLLIGLENITKLRGKRS